MGMGHLRGAGRGAQGKPGHSPAMTTRAAGLPGRRNGPSDTKPSPSPGSTVPFRQQGWDQLSPAPGPCAKETVQGKQESGAMPRERKAAPSLLASPAALPPQRALSHPPPYLLSAFPTEGVKPTVVCSTPVETKAPTSSVVQKRHVTPNPLPPALPTGPWEGHGSAGHGAPIPSLPLAWGALRTDQTQQRGVPAPRARSSSSR